MPIYAYPHEIAALHDKDGNEIAEVFFEAPDGAEPLFVPEAGSAAVDIVLGPVQEVGSPQQLRIVRCTIAGSPFPTFIRLDGERSVGYGVLTLQQAFEAQTSSRRIVEITLTQDIDVTPTDTPLTFTVRASNGRTEDSASFTTQFEQR